MRKAIPLWQFATTGKHAGYMVHRANPDVWRPAMFHELPEGWRFDGPRAYPIAPAEPRVVGTVAQALTDLLVQTIVRSARTF